MTVAAAPPIQDFIQRWERSGAAERANYALFLSELCDLLDVPRPDPTGPDDEQNAYVFERAVTFQNGDGTTSTGRIDLYRRGCFVLEAKQGSDRPALSPAPLDGKARKQRRGTAVRGTQGWDDAMLAARGQAELYARALPVSEGWPPFLIVVDVGYSIELYADFSRSGKTYIPFPDPRSHRLRIRDLERQDVRERLRLIWTDPLSLDPTRRSARVTREVADQLARLAKSLEESGHAPETVAQFLMRWIFTMFAEDVELIRAGGFTGLLESLRGEARLFPDMVQSLWATMNTGGFSPILRQRLLRFNGGLFESTEALDTHRKHQQAQHPGLSITDMYNVLEKLRAGAPLSDRDRVVHEQGLVSVLKQIHDDLDAAVFAAYGWPVTLTDEEILERLVALNAERAAEERRGIVRWLRPEFQNPQGAGQTALDTGEETAAAVETGKQEKAAWPNTMAEQAKAVRTALLAQPGAVSPEQLARSFKSARLDRVEALLETLATLGQAREVAEGRFTAS